jgi:hypothetical protein
MRRRGVQDDDQPRAAKAPGSTFVTAVRVTAARQKMKLKTDERSVARETASAKMR